MSNRQSGTKTIRGLSQSMNTRSIVANTSAKTIRGLSQSMNTRSIVANTSDGPQLITVHDQRSTHN
jgi:hypothetical protein